MIIFGEINVAMFDWPWSGIHAFSGLCLGIAFGTLRATRRPARFWSWGLGLLIVWELIEVTLRLLDIHAHEFIAPLKASVAGFAFGQESLANTLGDLIIGSIGLIVGRWVSRWLTPKGHSDLTKIRR